MIKTLQAGRAVAALMVVLHHAGQAVHEFRGGEPAWVRAFSEHGYLGVDFFFVLSGFIIYHTNHKAFDLPGWSRRYLASRAVRVYAPYLPVGLGVAAIYTAFPTLTGAQLNWGWLASITLAPVKSPALTVAWTLQHEILFYAMFWVLHLKRLVLAGSLLWIAVILICWERGISVAPLQLIDFEFLIGAFFAWCYVTDRLRHPIWLAGMASACFAAFFIVDNREYSVLFGAGIGFLLLPLIRAEVAGRIPVSKFIVLAGAASYAIYLVHQPFISVFIRLLARYDIHWLPTLAVLIIATVLAGLAYHLLYERPSLGFFRRLLEDKAERAGGAAVLPNRAP